MTTGLGFRSRLSAAYLLAVGVVLAFGLFGWQGARDAADAATQLTRAQEVLADLARARVETLQIELSTQAFRVSGDPARLAERDLAISAREARLLRLREQTAGNAEQQARWLELRQVIDQRLAISRRVEELRRTQGTEPANAYVAAAPLQATRQRSQALFDVIEAEEIRLVGQSLQAQQRARARLAQYGASALVCLLLLLSATYVLMLRKLRETEASRLALAASEERISTTLSSIGDAVIATDTRLRVTEMNPVAERLTGWPLEQARGRPVGELLCLLDGAGRQPLPSPAEQVLATGRACELNSGALLVTRSGQELPVADSAAPILDRQGQVGGVVMVFRDDSLARAARLGAQAQNRLLEHRVAERTEMLEDRESHLRNLINNVPAMIAYVDAGERYGYVNSLYRQRFAPDQPDITGKTVREVLGDARYATAGPLIKRVLQGDPQTYDWEPFPGVWQVIHYAPRTDAQGIVVGYYVLGTDITERRLAEQALRASEQQLSRVLEGADQGYWDWNLQTDAFQVSARWETMLGYAVGEMQVDTGNWPALVHPEDLPKAMASIERHLAGVAPSHEAELRCKARDGSWRWILTRGRIVERDAAGAALRMSGTHTDITERKGLERAQREAAVVFENCYEGIFVADAQGLISKVNPAFTRITGYTEAEVRGKAPSVLASGRQDAGFYRDFWASLTELGAWHGEIWNRQKNGQHYVALQSVTVVHDDQGLAQHYISVFSDITRLKEHESELDRVAHHDALTGLPNRRLLSDRLQQAILRADRNGRQSAVCVLDLDDFKQINDLHGQAVGDHFLVGVAEHLRAVLRHEDTLARLGGDEFVVLLSDVDSTQSGASLLDRILAAVKRPVQVGEFSLCTSASIGVSLYPADHVDPDTLLRHADHAMLLAKQGGKNRYQLFDPEIDRLAQQRLDLLQRLSHALSRHEFELFYQRKVDLVNGDVVGVEALIRWRHPERGLLSPAEFLPLLQASELEQPVGEWVIDTALCQIEAWATDGLDMKVSVNVSAHHLMKRNFCDQLAHGLGRHPSVAPSSLELEVLETAAIADIEQAVDVLGRCRALGVGFSLDDFGTGYSSLTYLRRLPVEVLKIDQSFVRDMLTNQEDLSIVQGVIQLAAAFDRKVIAEGVETLAHGAALSAMGCRLAQGYGIARPMPAADVPAWCQQWQRDAAWLRFAAAPSPRPD